MFNKKYKITILNSKWGVLVKTIKVSVVPNKNDYIWYNEQYHEVINVIHSLNEDRVYVIVDEVSPQPTIKKINFE